MESLKKNFNFLHHTIAAFGIFFYVYQCNLTFLGLPFFNSSIQVSWFLFLIYSLIRNNQSKVSLASIKKLRTYKGWKRHFTYMFVLFVYSLILLIAIGHGDGSHIFDILFKIFIYGISIFWFWLFIFDDIEQFIRILLITGIIQTVVVLYCLYDPSITILLDATLNAPYDDSIYQVTSEMRTLYAGGIGCITSSGVVKYALTGLFPCAYYCIKKGRRYFLLFVVMAFTASMIARTGLLYDVVIASFIVLKCVKGKQATLLAIILLLIAYSCSVIFNSGKYARFFNERFYRYEDLKNDKGNGFFEAYFYGVNAHYPPINAETILGVGVMDGKSANGYLVNVDGGPMRTYSAIGIIGCLLFYFLVIRNQIRTAQSVSNKDSRHLLLLLLVCMIVGEWKEVTYFAFWPFVHYFFTAYLIEVEEKNKELV